MSYAKTAILLVALAFISHLSLLTPAKADGTGRWSVASVSGAAQIRAAKADWQPLGANVQVGIGQEIRTGKDGRVVLTRGDESVTISPSSSFEAAKARSGMMTRILQKAGSLLFKVHKRPNRHFEVETPYLVAAVKGTTFTVNVDDAGGAVHVIEGLVEVGSLKGADRVLVRPGRTASVGSGSDSKVQLGETPKPSKSIKGKQSKASAIDHQMGAASVDIETSSHGLFKNPEPVSGAQVASTASGGTGNGALSAENAAGGAPDVLGNDNSLSGSLNAGFGLGLSGGSDNAGGGASGGAGGAGGAAGAAGGAAGGAASGLALGGGNGLGLNGNGCNGNGNCSGHGKN